MLSSMAVYKIEFSYRIFKNQVIPIDYEGGEVAIKVAEPLANALEFDWKKVVQALYPVAILITRVTTPAVLEAHYL
jgi:hypothetical protein